MSTLIMTNSGEMFPVWLESEKKDREKLSKTAFPIENSDYYHIYLLELEEIKKHQWVLGERNNREITWNEAQWSWLIYHREEWVRSTRISPKK